MLDRNSAKLKYRVSTSKTILYYLEIEKEISIFKEKQSILVLKQISFSSSHKGIRTYHVRTMQSFEQ